jgi:DNA-binding NtrC family response regulator
VTVLERAGYQVIMASDGHGAEAALRDSDRPIDAFLTDVVMPGRSGPELADIAMEVRPGMPVLFISGYTASALEPRGLAGRTLLEKPFTPAQLEDAVATMLEERAPDNGDDEATS